MITGSNHHPEINDDWCSSIPLDATKAYTKEELVEIVTSQYPQYVDHALWLYEGPDYEDKTLPIVSANGTVVYDLAFHPWNGPHMKLIVETELIKDASDDDWVDEWRKEIAMEAGMLGGCDAYNDAMGY